MAYLMLPLPVIPFLSKQKNRLLIHTAGLRTPAYDRPFLATAGLLVFTTALQLESLRRFIKKYAFDESVRNLLQRSASAIKPHAVSGDIVRITPLLPSEIKPRST